MTSPMTGASSAAANDVLVDPLGRILAGGTARGQADDFALMRFTPAGTLDTTFDADGRVLTDFDAGGTDQLNSLALLPDGSIFAGGTTSSNFALVRYTAAGALDAGFGTAGRAVTDFEPGFFPGAPATSRDTGAKVLQMWITPPWAAAREPVERPTCRTRPVRLDGRPLADDDGPFNPFGASLFYAPRT